MICSSLLCLQNQPRYQVVVNLSRPYLPSATSLFHQQTPDSLPSKQLLQLRNEQLSSVSSIKTKSRHSSSSSTMVNSEELGCNRAKMHVNRFSEKISISDLKKNNALKRLTILSSSSSVQKVSIASQRSSIIDKLQTVQMEGKQILGSKAGMGQKVSCEERENEIFLPEPKHFMARWKKSGV